MLSVEEARARYEARKARERFDYEPPRRRGRPQGPETRLRIKRTKIAQAQAKAAADANTHPARRLRLLRGWSIEDCARHAVCGVRSVQRLETLGCDAVSPLTVERVARALAVDPAVLRGQ